MILPWTAGSNQPKSTKIRGVGIKLGLTIIGTYSESAVERFQQVGLAPD